MNHEEFVESVAGAQAWRDRRRLPAEALAHAEACAPCGELLGDLEAEAHEASLQPPVGYWSTFDERLRDRLAPRSGVLPGDPPARPSGSWRRAGLLLAAAAAVVAGVVAVGRRPAGSGDGADATDAAAVIRAATPADVDAAIAALGVAAPETAETDSASDTAATVPDDVLGIADPLSALEAELSAGLDEGARRELARVLMEASS
jgi:hypothetical protein